MEPGFTIAGRYRLDSHIAAGGMGSVWRGYDLSLEREVAVKLLLRGLPSMDKPVERFEREAKALARVKNPGCVEVYDVGEHPQDDELIRYIVMELVEGESLKDRLDRNGRLDPGEVMARIAEAADALDAAHGVGIVHRDVKPGNLLIDTADRTRVVDFGISTLTDATRLTQSSAVLGTLPYVSPEQFEDRETTPKSDIYALGAVAYECLTGRSPFTGTSAKAIIHAHLFVDPEPLEDPVPEAVALIVLRALAKDPDDRWGSCAELAEACRAAAEEPSRAAPIPREGDGGREDQDAEGGEPATAATEATILLDRPGIRRRGRRGAVVLAAVAAIVLLGALIAWQQWPETREILDGAAPTDAVTGESSTPADATTTPAPEVSPSPSGSATPSEPAAGGNESPAGQEGGGDSGGDDGGSDNGQTGTGDTGPGASEDDDADPPSDPTVPDVTGDLVSDAEAELRNAGFTNLEFTSTFYDSSATETCEVVEQDPPGGTSYDPADTITIKYYSPAGQNGGCR